MSGSCVFSWRPQLDRGQGGGERGEVLSPSMRYERSCLSFLFYLSVAPVDSWLRPQAGYAISECVHEDLSQAISLGPRFDPFLMSLRFDSDFTLSPLNSTCLLRRHFESTSMSLRCRCDITSISLRGRLHCPPIQLCNAHLANFAHSTGPPS